MRMTDAQTPRRPVVRYHGGKWKLAPWIISHFPAHRVYVEPFGGGGSILLRKPRCYAEVYNDLDDELVNLFRVARDHGVELAEQLRLTPYSRAEFEGSYERAACPIEQARRTVVRAFLGFGSNAHNHVTGFRSNSNRSGTTPAADWRNYPDALQAVTSRLQGVVIENRHACAVMRAHDGEQTLHYVDPPYVLDARDSGSDYRFEMSDQDHVELAEVLGGLRGTVVLSGYPSSLYDRLYSGWHRIERRAMADGAAPRCEVLWISQLPRIGDLFSEVVS